MDSQHRDVVAQDELRYRGPLEAVWLWSHQAAHSLYPSVLLVQGLGDFFLANLVQYVFGQNCENLQLFDHLGKVLLDYDSVACTSCLQSKWSQS